MKKAILLLLVLFLLVIIPINVLKAGRGTSDFIIKVEQKIEDGFKDDNQRLKWIDKVNRKIEKLENKIEKLEVKLDKAKKEKRKEKIRARIENLQDFLDQLRELLDQLISPTTYCGDGIIQQPNETGTGGPNNDGYEQCDTYDIIYQGWGYHCSPDCTIARCSLGQGRPCHIQMEEEILRGLQWCTDEGLWGECEIEE